MKRERAGLTPGEQRRAARVAELHGARDVAALVAMLDDPSWSVRRRVVDALGALDPDAVSPLCDLLRERRDQEGRIAAAVDALVQAVGEDPAPVLALTHHENAAVVADAVQVLGRARVREGLPRLVELLEHPDDNVALAAIEAVGHVGGRAAIKPLVDTVRSGNFFRVFPAIDVLGRTGDPRVIEPLGELLTDPRYALEAIRALGRTGDRGAVPVLASMLERAGPSTARIVALAHLDLEQRYAARFGDVAPVREALRATVEPQRVIVPLARALEGSDDAEASAIATLLGAIGTPAVEPHLLALIDRRPQVGDAAASALEEMDRRSERGLYAALEQGTSERRRALLPRIRTLGEAVPALLACLDDPEPEVRALACEALARIGDTSAAPRLFALLADPNVQVVQAATAAIHSLGSDVTEAHTLEALRSPEPQVRRAALRITGYFGYRAAFDALAEATRDPDPRLRDAAFQALAAVDDPRSREVLREGAGREEGRDRASAIRALGYMAADPRGIVTLCAALDDPDPWVRYFACQAVGRTGFEGAEAALARRLEDPFPQVRLAVIDALSQLQSDSAFAHLLEVARSEDADTRRAALVALGLSQRPEALHLLLDAAEDEDSATRLVAVSALGGKEAPGVVDVLARATRDPDPNVNGAAIGILQELTAPEASDALLDLVRAEPSEARILDALSSWTPTRVPRIVAAFQDADDELAPVLASALARLRVREAADALLELSVHGNAAARKAAVTVLGEFGTEEAIGALRHAASQDPDEEVRQIADVALDNAG